MFKPSSRAFGVATAVTLGALILAPSASAALLGSNGSNGALPVPALSGVTNSLPLSGNLLKPVGDLLGSSVGVGNLLGLSPVLGAATGNLGGLTNLGGVGGLTNLGGVGGLTNLGGLTGGLTNLGGTDSAGGELVDGVFESVGGTTLACDAAVPQLLQAFAGAGAGSLCALDPFNGGIVGLLGSL